MEDAKTSDGEIDNTHRRSHPSARNQDDLFRRRLHGKRRSPFANLSSLWGCNARSEG
jgi:hypothetical protein